MRPKRIGASSAPYRKARREACELFHLALIAREFARVEAGYGWNNGGRESAAGSFGIGSAIGPGAVNDPGDVFRVESALDDAKLLGRAPSGAFDNDAATAVGGAQDAIDGRLGKPTPAATRVWPACATSANALRSRIRCAPWAPSRRPQTTCPRTRRAKPIWPWPAESRWPAEFFSLLSRCLVEWFRFN